MYSVTSNSAYVQWVTDELSDSKVVYGNTDYGADPASWPNTVSDDTDVTYHILQLTGLSPFTIYYFRCISKDPSENEAVSGAYVFRTLR